MYAFIVNPNARTGLGLKVWHQLESILKEREIAYKAYITRYPNHAAEFARKLTSCGEPPTLIAVGGDGTINEVINGIRNLSKVTFGYIPIGSSNDFARSMKLPKKPECILEQILNPAGFTYINVGRMVSNGTGRCFAVSSGIGFDAEVCFHIASSRIKRKLNKLRLGKLSYTGIALYHLATLSPCPMTITVDGQKKHFKKVFFATAMNQRYEGGGFKFCPQADPGDDLLDIIVISDIPKIKALLLLPTAFKGWHVHVKGVHIFTCRTAEIISEQALSVHTDGEVGLRASEVNFSLQPEKLKFIRG